jgi:hypothetical protein
VPARTPHSVSLRLLPLAILLSVSLYSTGFWIVDPLLQPSGEDYLAAESIVRQNWQQGDAVIVLPWWAARIREYICDLEFIQLRNPQAEDWSSFSRLWVVSLPGHRHDLFTGPFGHWTHPRLKEIQAGKLTVDLYDLPPPARVLYNFRDRLSDARVSMHEPQGPRLCSRWVENRWVCSRRDWNYVGRMIVELGDDPRKIIWAHPADYPLEIAYPSVPGGKLLRVHTGFTPPAARAPDGAPVTLRVLMDGRELGRVVQQNLTGYFPAEWDISAAGPGPHQVTFVVTSPRGGMRHFCFDAQVRG